MCMCVGGGGAARLGNSVGRATCRRGVVVGGGDSYIMMNRLGVGSRLGVGLR